MNRLNNSAPGTWGESLNNFKYQIPIQSAEYRMQSCEVGVR